MTEFNLDPGSLQDLRKKYVIEKENLRIEVVMSPTGHRGFLYEYSVTFIIRLYAGPQIRYFYMHSNKDSIAGDLAAMIRKGLEFKRQLGG